MAMDFFEKLHSHLEAFPDRTALQLLSEGKRESYSFRRIAHEISALSRYLQARGVKPGDTVGILMENHPRWGIAFLAAQSLGARIVPFDILHTTETLAGLVRHAECVFLICSDQQFEKLTEIQQQLPEPLPGLLAGMRQECYGHWESIVEEAPDEPEFPLARYRDEDTLLLVYTSGTTGDPKGVMLSYGSVNLTVDAVLRAIRVSPEDHILSVLPLYHMLALMANFLIPLYLGATVTYLDVLDAQRILKCFREEGITIFVCVPQFFYLVHRRIFKEVDNQSFLKRYVFRRLFAISRFCNNSLRFNPGRRFFSAIHRNFGNLRLFAVGGARFDREVAQDFQHLGFHIIQAYGMTETTAVCTLAFPETGALGSVGEPLPHVRLKIEDPDEHGIGEVIVGGEHLMQGYWKNPEATAETCRNGWLHTGDLGRLDAQGFLHITGRKKEVIVLSSGKNIYPEEIEQAYEKQCPFIKEMCVLGVPDTGASEEQEKLHAVIVPDFDYLKSQQIVNAQEMIRYMLETISQKFPPYKRVRGFEIRREPLPRTTTRKVKRFEVQKEVEAGTAGGTAAEAPAAAQPRDAVEQRIFQLIRETGKTAVVNPKMSLELDCGFDSLERVEFLSTIQETFQVHISDEAATEIYTVQDLTEAVRGRLSGEIQDEENAGASVSWGELLRRPLSEQEERAIDKILRRRPFTELIYFGCTRLIWVIGKVFYRLRFEGQEHLGSNYPYMICPNHLSFLDGFLLSAALPLRVIRRLFFLGYSDYFGGPVMSFLGSRIKVVPVDADRHLRQALRLGAHGIDEKLVLCVFPEGERSIDGSLKVFRKGPAILAVELGIPVVPAAMLGTYEAWSRGSDRFRFRPVTIRFGPPITPEPGRESYEEFNQRLRHAVQELIDQGQNR